jgi:hypothetical protein
MEKARGAWTKTAKMDSLWQQKSLRRLRKNIAVTGANVESI